MTKAPLRITLGGGGSDLPKYIEKFGYGASVTATINRWVYVATHRSSEGWILKYRDYERADDYRDIKNDIVRETIAELIEGEVLDEREPLEIATFSDVPGGTGLGSSGAFGVALVGALMYWAYPGHRLDDGLRYSFAEIAYRVARDRLKQETGTQDFFASVFGGIRFLQYDTRKTYALTSLHTEIPYFLYLYPLGISRDSGRVLSESEYSDDDFILAEWGLNAHTAIAERKWSELFKILEEQDKRKMERISELPEVKRAISRIRKMKGVKCVKTMGAGKGGYLLVISEIPIEKPQFEPILISENGIEAYVV